MPITYSNGVLDRYKVYLKKKISGNEYALLDKDTKSSIVSQINIEENVKSPIIDVIISIKSPVQPLVGLGDTVIISVPEYKKNGNIIDEWKYNLRVLKVEYDMSGNTDIICKNLGYWLATQKFYIKRHKNESTFLFIRRTATEIGFPIDFLHHTFFQLDSHLFERTTYYKAWLSSLTDTIINEKLNLMLLVKFDGLSLDIVPNDKKKWYFESRDNLSGTESISRTISLLDDSFINKAIGVIPSNGSFDILSLLRELSSKTSTAQNDISIKDYSLFSQEYDISSMSVSEALVYLKNIVDNAKPKDNVEITVPAMNDIELLESVYLEFPEMGILSEYYVESKITIVNADSAIHRLSLSRYKDIPQIAIDQIKNQSGITILGVDLSDIILE